MTRSGYVYVVKDLHAGRTRFVEKAHTNHDRDRPR
jgi:hypothetical protein